MFQKKQITEQQALSKLTGLCARAEHCSGEMLDKLRQWRIDEEAQARIMEYLIKNKFVDDERYTRFFINDKISFVVNVKLKFFCYCGFLYNRIRTCSECNNDGIDI